MNEMNVEKRLISELTFDGNNARKHSIKNIESIKTSLKEFGQRKNIVIDTKGKVLAGNGTLESAKALGWTHIYCSVADLTEVEAKAFAIADNRTAELAEWDDEVLAKSLEDLAADSDHWLEALAFDEKDLEKLTGGGGGGGGDLDPMGGTEYRIIVSTSDESAQAELFDRLKAEGFECMLLMS